MFIKSSLFALAAVASIPATFARELIVERDGRPFYPRRFGQEQCGGIGGTLGSACAGQICGVLGGRVPGVLLAAADPCAQQNLADDIIDASKTQDATTATNMVSLAIKVRQCEKNTPPDFTKNPPALRNSVFCLQAPRNSQLNGLVQGQDPANDPELFFDVATKSTVLKGSQANTFPFGQAPANLTSGSDTTPAADSAASSSTEAPATSATPVVDAAADGTCTAPSTVTVTVTVTPTPTAAAAIADVTDTCATPTTVTVTAAAGAVDVATTAAEAAATTTAAAAATATAVSNAASGALDFGSCTNPAVEFGPAFDGRKLSEFSFEPEDRTEFAQSSALNGQIVLTAICNILNDKCKAPASTVTACKNAITAVANVTGGGKADQFNAALGIQTNFANIPAAPGGGPGSEALATTANFNKCGVPSVAFGIFDGRTEDSFEPVGADFQHGSALNPSIITTFICNTLVNTCDANQVAINDCQTAINATNGLSGQALADAFNSAISAHVASS